MEIQQSTITVRMFEFALTEGEALNVCADPSDFTSALRKALVVDVAPASDSPRSKPQNGGGKAKTAAVAKVTCPHCGDKVAKKFINYHIRKRHPEQAAAAN